MFRFEDTMGIAAQEDQMKTTRTRSRLYARILSVRGPAQLAKLFPHLQNRVQRFLANELSPSRVDPDGSVCVPLAETCRIMSSRLMGMMFFGEKLSMISLVSNDKVQILIDIRSIRPRFRAGCK